MKRILLLALAVSATGCVATDRGSFVPGDASDPDAVDCEEQIVSYMVQDILDAEQISHYTCEAPEAADDGPAFDGWFSPGAAVPGGVVAIDLFSDHVDDLVGRTVSLDAPGELGHTRVRIEDAHIRERGARLLVMLTPTMPIGEQILRVALVDDYGDVEATGPAVEVPVQVVAVHPERRGLRISMAFWSEEDPEAAPNVNLQIFEPSGNRLDADAPTSDIGGQLEHDANADCVPSENVESVSWPEDTPPGRYGAFAFFKSRCDTDADFHWQLTFSYTDRLLGVWEGEIEPPHDDDPESEIVELSYVDVASRE